MTVFQCRLTVLGGVQCNVRTCNAKRLEKIKNWNPTNSKEWSEFWILGLVTHTTISWNSFAACPGRETLRQFGIQARGQCWTEEHQPHMLRLKAHTLMSFCARTFCWTSLREKHLWAHMLSTGQIQIQSRNFVSERQKVSLKKMQIMCPLTIQQTSAFWNFAFKQEYTASGHPGLYSYQKNI